MEVGIRKGAWRRVWRYPAYLWSLRWVYAVQKTPEVGIRRIPAYTPPNTPLLPRSQTASRSFHPFLQVTVFFNEPDTHQNGVSLPIQDLNPYLIHDFLRQRESAPKPVCSWFSRYRAHEHDQHCSIKSHLGYARSMAQNTINCYKHILSNITHKKC